MERWMRAAKSYFTRGLPGTWMGPALVFLVAMWVAMFLGNIHAQAVFVILTWVFMFLHVFRVGNRYILGPEYKVGSLLQDLDDEDVQWEIVRVADNRRSASVRIKHSTILRQGVTFSAYFIKSEFELITNEQTLSA